VRCQVTVPGQSTYGSPASRTAANNQPPHLRQDQEPWEPCPYCRLVPRLFEHMRSRLGDEIELLHDVHERIPPIMAIQLARDLEPYHLFFLEDALAPEDNDYFRILRSQSSIPIAMGELFVNQAEYAPLIRDRLIDIDESLAAKYPFPEHPYNGAWPEIRRRDGTVIRP